MNSDKKTCTSCGEEFLIIGQESDFYDEKGLPTPDNCPLCRQRKRLERRSEQKLYGSVCDKCGKDIVIAFKPPEDQQVYCKTCYLEYFDKFDPVSESGE